MNNSYKTCPTRCYSPSRIKGSNKKNVTWNDRLDWGVSLTLQSNMARLTHMTTVVYQELPAIFRYRDTPSLVFGDITKWLGWRWSTTASTSSWLRTCLRGSPCRSEYLMTIYRDSPTKPDIIITPNHYISPQKYNHRNVRSLSYLSRGESMRTNALAQDTGLETSFSNIIPLPI